MVGGPDPLAKDLAAWSVRPSSQDFLLNKVGKVDKMLDKLLGKLIKDVEKWTLRPLAYQPIHDFGCSSALGGLPTKLPGGVPLSVATQFLDVFNRGFVSGAFLGFGARSRAPPTAGRRGGVSCVLPPWLCAEPKQASSTCSCVLLQGLSWTDVMKQVDKTSQLPGITGDPFEHIRGILASMRQAMGSVRRRLRSRQRARLLSAFCPTPDQLQGEAAQADHPPQVLFLTLLFAQTLFALGETVFSGGWISVLLSVGSNPTRLVSALKNMVSVRRAPPAPLFLIQMEQQSTPPPRNVRRRRVVHLVQPPLASR